MLFDEYLVHQLASLGSYLWLGECVISHVLRQIPIINRVACDLLFDENLVMRGLYFVWIWGKWYLNVGMIIRWILTCPFILSIFSHLPTPVSELLISRSVMFLYYNQAFLPIQFCYCFHLLSPCVKPFFSPLLTYLFMLFMR